MAPLLLARLLPSKARRWIYGLAALALAAFWLWLSGVHHERAKWERLQAQDEKVYLEGVVRAGRVADRIVTKYLDRDRIVRVTGDTIVKEVPVYVTAQADAACTVPAGFVRVHDAAAANVLPGPASPADEAPSGVALSAVAETVTLNYTEIHAMRAQCEALQEWAVEVSGKDE